ncbi:hypothetical protein [Ornithinimicrobium pekingense]|uniref:Type VII secretion protein EccB n=1 Tax=Ornithinimicrobium pekingense TaxID=384677 RepID=A0ABQ2FEI1_9MICO|nr:hypothetical protein [Ornithinimicrobium pekingense]GGK81435.1 hypothetical protein GCM10011509_32390 [Ornithinimicrobium pekingense]
MSDDLDRSALVLLDRADELAPVMSVEPDAVIARGRRKVHRRRTSAAAGVGSLALVGALWLGGPLNPFAATGDPVPASVSWQDGVAVDLFDNEPNPVHEADRVHWTGELRSAEGAAFPELVLTRDGEELEPLPAQDGPGDVLVFGVEGLRVAVWESPSGSLGETPLWSPGVHRGQGGTAEVDGALLRYAVAEFVPGASAAMEELYWYDETAAHSASGAPVASTRMGVNGSEALVMLDEARGVWGATPLGEHLGPPHVARLVSGSGLTGWMGGSLVTTSVGVLPPGSTDLAVTPGTATLASTPLGSHTAVMAADPSLTDTVPQVRFTLDGEEHVLESYAQDTGRPLAVGSGQVLVTAQPEALELRRGEDYTLIPAGDLQDGTAFTVPTLGGHAVVVPGWQPDADVEDLRALVGSDGDERWVEVKAAHVGALFDGRPLVVLGLDRGVVGEGETVRGVGVAGEGDVTPHTLAQGVVLLDPDL